MKSHQIYDGGKVTLEGLSYDLSGELNVKSEILPFGRIDNLAIHGEHEVELSRETHSIVIFEKGKMIED